MRKGAKKRRGRPTKTPAEGERASLGLRVTAEIKRRLDEAAKQSGRSQSQEAELRIERSFDFDAELGGSDLSRIVKAIAAAMRAAGERAMPHVNLLRRLHKDKRAWLDNPYCFDQMVKAANAVLEAVRPPGEIVLPIPLELVPAEGRELLEMVFNIGDSAGSTVAATALTDRVPKERMVAMSERLSREGKEGMEFAEALIAVVQEMKEKGEKA